MQINDFIDFDADALTINDSVFPNTEENIIRYIVPYIQLGNSLHEYFLRYMAGNGCVNVLKCFPDRRYLAGMLFEAAACKQFEVVKYMCEKQTPFSMEDLAEIAARSTEEIYEYLN